MLTDNYRFMFAAQPLISQIFLAIHDYDTNHVLPKISEKSGVVQQTSLEMLFPRCAMHTVTIIYLTCLKSRFIYDELLLK